MPVIEDRRDVAVFEVPQPFNPLAERRLDGDDLDVGVLLFQVPPRTHQRAARAEAGDEVGDLGNVAIDLRTGALVVRHRVRIVRVLVEEAELRMQRCHLLRTTHRTVAALRAGRQDELRAEHLQHLATLDADALRHQDHDRVTLHLGDGGQGDAGVTRRGLEDRLTRL